MGLNTLYFGVEASSRTRRVAVHVTLSVFALAFYGVWIDFLPEPWVERTSLYASVIAGVMIAAWLAWANISGRNEAYRGGKVRMLLAAPFCAIVAAGFIWCALAHGVAGGVTRMWGGEAFLQPAQMHTVHSLQRWECDYRLKGGPMDSFLFDHLCISSTYYGAHPRHRVEVELKGWRGSMGFYVTEFHHRRDLGSYVDRRRP